MCSTVERGISMDRLRPLLPNDSHPQKEKGIGETLGLCAALELRMSWEPSRQEGALGKGCSSQRKMLSIPVVPSSLTSPGQRSHWELPSIPLSRAQLPQSSLKPGITSPFPKQNTSPSLSKAGEHLMQHRHFQGSQSLKN